MTEYSEVAVYTGKDLAARQQETELQPIQTAQGLMAAEQARAVAEVQAALVIAAGRPRNELRARDKLLQACQRATLASSAVYQYSRGGSSVSGPSIRLAETAARTWGNMTYGFRELSRRPGESECEAYAWDWESNVKAVRQFTVKHWRDTKSGGYMLKDERDIYELVANQAQRRVRAAILEIIPGDIVEDAVRQCEATMKANIGDVQEAAKKLLEVFEQMGVSRAQVEARLGHRIDAIQPAQVLSFRKIYMSIKDGFSSPEDWFAPAAPAAPAAPEAKAPEKKPAPKPKAEPKPAPATAVKPSPPGEGGAPAPDEVEASGAPAGGAGERSETEGVKPAQADPPVALEPGAEEVPDPLGGKELSKEQNELADALLERTCGDINAAADLFKDLSHGHEIGEIAELKPAVCNTYISLLKQRDRLAQRDNGGAK